ncbi:hypothetical protein CLV84_3129 [Neolewinella xylanilytica]|uniref:Uncharacterized protein n=1 Tax=Neolewinella xylanilytica TaxID=1514080 RepID=A0A2S6I4U9_9BACT|nr:hypothetical protein [Neolewinella xylanilytica]PPK86207.1 hypothetical protein CLV84_3129 [Neolewinella xylanilytica]
MPYLAFPQILGGYTPTAWLVFAAIVLVVLLIIRYFYLILREE